MRPHLAAWATAARKVLRRGSPAASRVLARWMLPALMIGALVAIQLVDPPFRARIRETAFDQLQRLAPLPYRDELPVRVIAIDDASLASLGQWPWPRTVLARLTDQLVAMGARVVALDIVLSEADRTSPEQLATLWPPSHPLHPLLLQQPPHDKALAESFKRVPVVLGFPIEPMASDAPLPASKSAFMAFGGDARPWLPAHPGALSDLPVLVDAASGTGAISLMPSNDGVLRAIPLVYRIKDALYPGLGLETLRLFAGLKNVTLQVADGAAARRGQVPGIQGVALGNEAFVPTAPDGRVWLHFRPLAAERYVSARDVLAGKVDAAKIAGHIVFIGATAKGLGDNVVSPLGEIIPGIEGHVQLAEQLLTGEQLVRPAWEDDALLALLLGTWLLLVLLLKRCRPAWAVLLAGAVVVSLFALSGGLFVTRQMLLDPLYPALAVAAVFLVTAVPQYLDTERQQRWIQAAFARYVSPNRVKYLQAHPEDLALGGVYRECSFVATDLEGFTPMMEKYPPDMLSGLLNDYLDNMIQIAFRHEGTIDRIVGDAVVVMFSAPAVQPDHAKRALACALEMDAFAHACSQQHQAQGIPFGRTRIGINTGVVLIGNFGGQSMLDYRALGDAINTAARLESVNGQLGTRICISGSSVVQCAGFVGRPVGRLLLKGKREAVAAFEPLSREEADSPRVQAYRAAYALMDAQADAKDSAAKDAFCALASQYPDDPLARFHAKRLTDGDMGCLVVFKSK